MAMGVEKLLAAYAAPGPLACKIDWARLAEQLGQKDLALVVQYLASGAWVAAAAPHLEKTHRDLQNRQQVLEKWELR